MKKLIILFFPLIGLTISCGRHDEVIDLTAKCEFDGNILSACFSGMGSFNNGEIVITNNESYQEFGDSMRILYCYFSECDTVKLPYIDFNKQSLIGKKRMAI